MKRKLRHPRVKRVSAPRSYGGAFGLETRGPGTYVLAKGLRTVAYGQKILVYDRGVILPRLLSITAAHPLMLDWFKDHAAKASRFFASKRRPQEPILRGGTIVIDRGRLWQPWAETLYAGSDAWKLAGDLTIQLRRYEKFAEIATTRTTAKTGVKGWFCLARTEAWGRLMKAKRPKKRKRRADTRAAKAKGKARRSRPRVGRGSKARVQRGAGKHRLARGRTVRRTRKGRGRKR